MSCLLCKASKADKTNSHIISDFLIRSMLSLSTDGKRSEKTHNNTISTSSTSFYFGRDVREDEIEAIAGRQLTAEEIESNINPYTKSYIFCTPCERRLSFVESLFNEKFYKELKRFPKDTGSAKFGDVGLFKLFWLSIIWRCSIIRLHDFALSDGIEERLRQLIDTSLGQSMKETEELIAKNEESISREIIGVLFANDIENPTGTYVNCESRLGEPYTILINEFYLAYFNSEDDLEAKIKKIRGVTKKMPAAEFLTSRGEEPKVMMLNKNEYLEVNRYYLDMLVNSRLDFVAKRFADEFSKTVGKNPSTEKIQKFVKRYGANHAAYGGDTDEVVDKLINAEIGDGLD